MKVANIIEEGRYGGPQAQILGVAERLKVEGIETVVICPKQESERFYTEAVKRKVVVMWRDGRDVMVSWYHHCLYPNERDNLRLVRSTHQALAFNAPDDVRSNLPIFIEYCFTRQEHPGFTWADFVRVWHEQRNVVNTFYETLRKNTSAELGRTIRELTSIEIPKEHIDRVVMEFSFEPQAGRKIGVENKQSFMRKGIVGDWKNVFSQEAREIFDHYAGQELIELGYEKDRSWVTTQPGSYQA